MKSFSAIILKKSKFFFATLFCLSVVWGTAYAQEEMQPARNSNLVGIALPANAQRLSPASVPAEVKETFEKIVAAGNGKFSQGETEVLVWGGASYKKANAMTTVNRLTATLKSAGWQFSVEGDENGVTLFTVFKDGATRRALIGFYGATDEALIFAWSELLPAGGDTKNQVADDVETDRTENLPARNSGNSRAIVGTWTNGSVSMLAEKNMTTGVVTNRNGSTFKWVFTADGRFESIGLIQSTMYGCTTSLFNDKRGRYEISGSNITLIPSKNFWRNTYSCSPASNKERDYTLERETYEFRTKTNEYGKQMICLANAKGESCYERAE